MAKFVITGQPYDYNRDFILMNDDGTKTIKIHFHNTYGKSWGTTFYKHAIRHIRSVVGTGRLKLNKEYVLDHKQAKQVEKILLKFIANHPTSQPARILKERWREVFEILHE